MTDPAHGWMIMWNFSIEHGSFCMTQSEAKDANEIRQFAANRLGCGTDLTDAFDVGAYNALKNGNPRFVRPARGRTVPPSRRFGDCS
jgi:hypothetical protein